MRVNKTKTFIEPTRSRCKAKTAGAKDTATLNNLQSGGNTSTCQVP